MIEKEQKGVSPIIGILLLLGLSVGLFALASNIFFSTVSVSSSPKIQLDTSHTYDGANDADVTVKIVRNLNVNDLEYFTEDKNANIVKPRIAFGSEKPGTSETINNVDAGHRVVITGDVESGSFVVQTYTVPPKGI